MIYAEELVPGLNRFYSGHFQTTLNFKTFLGYAPCIGVIIVQSTIRYQAEVSAILCFCGHKIVRKILMQTLKTV